MTFSPAGSVTPIDPARARQLGLALTQRIQQEFTPSNTVLVSEALDEGRAGRAPAFNWSVGIWLSALNARARLDRSRLADVTQYIDATDVYWNPAGPVPGYDVLPVPKPVDRYYDDNAWMVLALLESYTMTKRASDLDRAKRAYVYAASGEDKVNGGVFWRESDRGASRNTCASAPTAVAAARLHRITKEPEYLAFAERQYEWTKRVLQDPADGLYWDNIAANGTIERMKWSYNSGLMLQLAAELFEITKRPEYAADALRIEAASIRHWVDPTTGAFRCDGKFAHHLMEGWELRAKYVPGPTAEATQAQRIALQYVVQSVRDSAGWYGPRWDRRPSKPWSPVMIIDQASVARAALLAW